MVYSNKFVMCVLLNGHPQKELANGVVKIPFGEYALRFRNKNNRRALVKFTIDGEDVSGGGYIIPANSYIDIERWSDKAVKFKFVSLDSEEAVDFGKNGPNDDKVKGTIEARFYLEKESFKSPVEHHHHWHYPTVIQPTYPRPPIWYTHTTWSSNSSSKGLGGVAPTTYSSNTVMPTGLSGGVRGQSCVPCGQSLEMNHATTGATFDGCTVEGNYSAQSFHTVYFDAETDYVALRLFLQGYEGEVAAKPAKPRETVKSRKLRELEEENKRLKLELEEKAKQAQQEAEEAAALQKLEEENRKLREKLERSS